jgi:hypothetical protein
VASDKFMSVVNRATAARNNGDVRTVRQIGGKMNRFGRVAVRAIAVGAVAGLGACVDSGLPDRNLPHEAARNREFAYAAYQPTASNTPIAVAGRHWIGSLPVESIPDRMLVPVGNVEGTVIHALRGRSAPYDRLYAPVGEGRWRPYVRLN